MFSTAIDIALIAAIAVITVAVVALVGFKLSRSSRELGSEAELATYNTLHTAGLAGSHLRNGLTPDGAAKAAGHLRGMLDSSRLVITDETAVLAWDPDGPGHDEEAMELARKVLASGRTQVYRRPGGAPADVPPEELPAEAVFSPIRVQERVVGTIGAYSVQVRPSLVRAANEVAAWVATQIELAELDASRTLLMEAEVRALRAQISPHFIYNSLNAIASYILTDPVRARELVIEFADFTRYSFRRHGDFTTVAEELKSIDRYLLLERARFGDRLKVSLQIGPEVLSTVIPFLSLQPLVENAVRHGLEAKEGPGHITITARDDGEFAVLGIEDDGVGMDPEKLRQMLAGHTPGDHVGLRNVDSRLRQVYGDDHGLVIETAPGAGTLITMRIPKFQPDHEV
ncbi:regulator of cell autolysis [Arthrobacter crystallopoietes BAB-32]|uniref:Regulator of cell autolysis n=1 Tax=Arthrobacter crystallopoietes BAB-32 TaxID=1246476 RepID=N1UUP3_9MICC|nr:histidine kinase [Arthrobacter crystallopoietes]EMY32750.1 regulator of cell autolysis [Arthrobacter crystallopoietes BAB-32]